ncbi:hypothetical protein P4O66_007306, partial [Electrophorus voltai]
MDRSWMLGQHYSMVEMAFIWKEGESIQGPSQPHIDDVLGSHQTSDHTCRVKYYTEVLQSATFRVASPPGNQQSSPGWEGGVRAKCFTAGRIFSLADRVSERQDGSECESALRAPEIGFDSCRKLCSRFALEIKEQQQANVLNDNRQEVLPLQPVCK